MYIEELLAVGSTVKAGAYDLARYTKSRYISLLQCSKVITKILYVVERREPLKLTHNRICNLLETMNLDESDGRLRKQPYCILLYGPPGSGKTSFAINLATNLLKARYGKAYADEVVTLNETDEFQSEYRTNHKVVIFDDLAAENPTIPSAKNPFRKIMDFVNNIKKTSLNPNLEMKGNVYIQPDLVIITTNMKVLMGNVHSWMPCEAAIDRRINKHIHIFRKDSKQTFKVRKKYNYIEGVDPKYYKQNNDDAQVELENMSSETLLSQLRHEFIMHLNDQEEFVTTINSSYDQRNLRQHSDAFYLLHDCYKYFCNSFRRELVQKPVLKRAEVPLTLEPQNGTYLPTCFDPYIFHSFLENVPHKVRSVIFVPHGLYYQGPHSEEWLLYSDGGAHYTVDFNRFVTHSRWTVAEVFKAFERHDEYYKMELYPSKFPGQNQTVENSEECEEEVPPLDPTSVIESNNPLTMDIFADSNSLAHSSVSDSDVIENPFLDLMNEDIHSIAEEGPGLLSRLLIENDLPILSDTVYSFDPLIEDLLRTKPPTLKLVGYEWKVANCGNKGDFLIQVFTGQELKYVAVEVTSSPLSASLIKTKSKQVNNIAEALSASLDGIKIHTVQFYENGYVFDLEVCIYTLFVNWFNSFKALRCANNQTLK